MPELSVFSAFLVGLLGGTHCVGMCGGITAALSLQLPSTGRLWPYYLTYNLGRIASYSVAGIIAGALGASALLLHEMLPVQQALFVLANFMLIALGLYLAGIWRFVTVFERVGSVLWKHLQPLMRRWLPIQNLPGALVVGALWGWLPCGLVYSVLVTALASGNALTGGMLMLAFGLGTLPNLLAMGVFAQQLRPFLQQLWVRRSAGIIVAGLGAWNLLRYLSVSTANG